jgi:hypothetical protein
VTGVLRQLQGVWFPTHLSVEGRLIQEHIPAFPAPREVALMTVLGNAFHVSVNAEYYWTGGRLDLSEGPNTMWFVYPGIPDEYNTAAHYQLNGDELLLYSRPDDRGRLSSVEDATRDVRVAPEPMHEMLALFELIMRGWT